MKEWERMIQAFCFSVHCLKNKSIAEIQPTHGVHILCLCVSVRKSERAKDWESVCVCEVDVYSNCLRSSVLRMHAFVRSLCVSHIQYRCICAHFLAVYRVYFYCSPLHSLWCAVYVLLHAFAASSFVLIYIP